MRATCLRALSLFPALGLALAMPVRAEQMQPATGAQRMIRPVAPLAIRPAARPLLVVPATGAKAPLSSLQTLPPGARLVPARPLSDAEKGALLKQVQELAASQHLQMPTGIASKAVLTPLRPYLPNQASIQFDSGVYGLNADGSPWITGGPVWALAGKSAGIGVEFMPAKAGQTMIVVYNLSLSTHSDYKVAGGYPAQALNNKVVFALTPTDTSPQFAGLAHTAEGQYSYISSIEIFVAQ